MWCQADQLQQVISAHDDIAASLVEVSTMIAERAEATATPVEAADDVEMEID